MNLVVLTILLALLEATGQIIAMLWPAYDVLFLQPDQLLGWKHVPNFRGIWAGAHWYAADYSVKFETNSAGFRDIERTPSKPAGIRRVALIGDSLIEGLQVPFHRTAGQVLERRLNSQRYEPPEMGRWEVLNFGVSNYGVGQYLLTWEEHARHYQPDYTAILVAKFHMDRTINKYEWGTFSRTLGKRLWIRPTFRIGEEGLIFEPAEDIEEFARVQGDQIQGEFGGRRVRKRKRIITLHFADILRSRLPRVVRRSAPAARQPNAPSSEEWNAAKVLEVNLRIIEELGKRARDTGSSLVIMDVSKYFGDDETISLALRELAFKNDFGYIPLYRHLLRATENGIETQWTYDTHWNEAGNNIVGAALHQCVQRSLSEVRC